MVQKEQAQKRFNKGVISSYKRRQLIISPGKVTDSVTLSLENRGRNVKVKVATK